MYEGLGGMTSLILARSSFLSVHYGRTLWLSGLAFNVLGTSKRIFGDVWL